MSNSFENSIAANVSWLLGKSFAEVILCHHNDSDGISSGAILTKALERAGISHRRIALEQSYPEVVEQLCSYDPPAGGRLIILADFGSGMLPELVSKLDTVTELLVIDHHQIATCADARVHLVNCREHEFSGESDYCAAMIAALFALQMADSNRDLLQLAAVGAYGDFRVLAPNKGNQYLVSILEKASQQNNASRDAKSIAETELGSKVVWGKLTQPTAQLVKWIDALGAFGYQQGGVDVALKGLLEGFDERYSSWAENLDREFKQNLANHLSQFPVQKYETGQASPTLPTLHWFNLANNFDAYGVKSVGLACELLLVPGSLPPAADSSQPIPGAGLQNNPPFSTPTTMNSAPLLVPGSSYILGFQQKNQNVPGLGPILSSGTKVSMRVGIDLYAQISTGMLPKVSEILSESVTEVGGVPGACHSKAGAANIPESMELDLVAEIGIRLARS